MTNEAETRHVLLDACASDTDKCEAITAFVHAHGKDQGAVDRLRQIAIGHAGMNERAVALAVNRGRTKGAQISQEPPRNPNNGASHKVRELFPGARQNTKGILHELGPPEPEESPPSDYKSLDQLRINFAHWDNETPPDQDWGVYNRFPARQCAILSGEGAIGKSSTLLHLAASHALGVDWLGAVLDRGPSIFTDCEDEEKVIWRRLAPICNHYKVSFSDLLKGGLELISLVGHDPVMAVASRSGKIETTKRYAELLEMAGDLKPRCIAIASSANVYAGSENDRSQVQQFAGYMTRVAQVAGGYLVLAQHPSLTGISTDTGLSGTTQWHNAVRARAYMKGVKSEPGEQTNDELREIVFKKNQYGKKDETIVLKWQNGMFLPVPGVWSLDKVAAEAKADDVFLKLLRRFNDQNQDVGVVSGTNYAPSVFAKHPDAAGLSSKHFREAMQRLLDKEAIINEPFGPASKGRKHLVIA